MGICKDCSHYTDENSYCDKHKSKKLEDASCKSFRNRTPAADKKLTAETRRLNDLVTWMRTRGVIAVKSGTLAITLGSIVEPNVNADHNDSQPPTPEEIRERARKARADLWYQGGVPNRKGK